MKNDPIEYYTKIEGNRIIIEAKYKIPLINKLLLIGFSFFVLFMLLNSSSKIPTPERYFFLIATSIAIMLGVLISISINKNKQKKLKVIIDKNSKKLLYPFEDFSVDLGNIKGLKIEEKPVFMGRRVSFIKLILSSGEKVIDFPFFSYNKAEEIIKIIQNNL